jgi:hypothetical protein
MGAQVLVEQNYFSSTKLAIVTDLDSDEEGYAVDRNNVFVDSTTRITKTGSLSVGYSYSYVLFLLLPLFFPIFPIFPILSRLRVCVRAVVLAGRCFQAVMFLLRSSYMYYP